ncbi:hypothetical protein [Alteromonas sp. D210916BOD_24]|uniref:hypothetical protein n=1 Tax=Alteromonas sp. D210916BOD_24 TaxID=3157618 RepID=UPI00399C898C
MEINILPSEIASISHISTNKNAVAFRQANQARLVTFQSRLEAKAFVLELLQRF